MFRRIFLSAFVILVSIVTSSIESQAATISGKIAFEGAAPTKEAIKMDADASCKLAHPGGVESDDVIVNANGTLKDVFVYVKEGVSGKFDAPKTPVVLDQKGCQYTPKVFGIQTGQPLEIRNSDATLHNVHSLSTKTPQFNLGMPIQNMKLKKAFTAAEVMVKIKCEVHPWMSSYAGVLDHPFFSVSSDAGTYEIKNLPPGQYVVEVWHQKYGAQTQNITVEADSDTKALDFSYKAA